MTTTISTKPVTLAAGFNFTECPRWRDGWLYFSDMHGKTVYRVNEAGTLESICRVEARPGGIGWLPNGDMLIVSMDDGRVLRLGAEGLSEYANMSSASETGVNDMIVSASGRAYAGKYSHARPPPVEPLLFVDNGGEWREAGDPLEVANGMVITADGKKLIVAESAGVQLSVFDLDETGVPGKRKLFAKLPEGHYPDGICGDAEGGVWVTCCMGPGVIRVEEGGNVTHSIPIDDNRFAYACALGGADGKTLFICTAESFDTVADLTLKTARIETVRVDFAQSGIP
jgi:sugar lactone lactonase YvrE